jgi:hypothetical protein
MFRINCPANPSNDYTARRHRMGQGADPYSAHLLEASARRRVRNEWGLQQFQDGADVLRVEV